MFLKWSLLFLKMCVMSFWNSVSRATGRALSRFRLEKWNLDTKCKMGAVLAFWMFGHSKLLSSNCCTLEWSYHAPSGLHCRAYDLIALMLLHASPSSLLFLPRKETPSLNSPPIGMSYCHLWCICGHTAVQDCIAWTWRYSPSFPDSKCWEPPLPIWGGPSSNNSWSEF